MKKLYYVTTPLGWAGDAEFSPDGDEFYNGESVGLGIFRGTRHEIKEKLAKNLFEIDPEDYDAMELLEELIFLELQDGGDHDVAIFL